MLRAKIVGIFENYSVTGIEVRHNAIDEVIHSGHFLCRDAQSSVFSYIIYPIDRVEIV